MRGRSFFESNRQSHAERAPFSEFAHQRDFAAQKLRQLLDDRETESRSAVFARDGRLPGNRVPLSKLLEDRRLLVERDADSRVLDFAFEPALVDPPRTARTRPPSGVNLIAFDNRLFKIC